MQVFGDAWFLARIGQRAGWGVYYGPNSKLNSSSQLHGPVQTSYRAEVSVLLHAVQKAANLFVPLLVAKVLSTK